MSQDSSLPFAVYFPRPASMTVLFPSRWSIRDVDLEIVLWIDSHIDIDISKDRSSSCRLLGLEIGGEVEAAGKFTTSPRH